MLSDPAVELLASIISIWEITIKWRAGKFPVSGHAYLGFLKDESVQTLALEPDHFRVLEDMPMHHRDPFDHLILAQAKSEGAAIITSDQEMLHYGVKCFPAMR